MRLISGSNTVSSSLVEDNPGYLVTSIPHKDHEFSYNNLVKNTQQKSLSKNHFILLGRVKPTQGFAAAAAAFICGIILLLLLQVELGGETNSFAARIH